MIVKLLTERHLEFLSITGGCRGPSESTLVKMSNCWKSHAAAQLCNIHGRSYHLRKNAYAYTFEPKIWDFLSHF